MKGRHLAVLVLPLTALALWWGFQDARKRLSANRMLAVVEARSQMAAQNPQVATRVLESNLAVLRQAAELDPGEVGIPMARAGQFLLMRRHAAAVRAYEEGIALEPRAELYANLARAHLDEGSRDLARQAIETAVLLDHNQYRHFRKFLEEERRLRVLRRERAEAAKGPIIFSDAFESGDLSRWSEAVQD
ncbi:MAG: hypothetical protein AAGN66_27640 [Acidobacteriota bacterium]